MFDSNMIHLCSISCFVGITCGTVFVPTLYHGCTHHTPLGTFYSFLLKDSRKYICIRNRPAEVARKKHDPKPKPTKKRQHNTCETGNTTEVNRGTEAGPTDLHFVHGPNNTLCGEEHVHTDTCRHIPWAVARTRWTGGGRRA